MEITQKEQNGITIISITGNLLGETNAEPICLLVDKSTEKGIARFILDLSALQYMNSTGLSVLVSILTKARKNKGDLVIINTPKKVMQLLEITKLKSIFNFGTSVEDAESQLKNNNKTQ